MFLSFLGRPFLSLSFYRIRQKILVICFLCLNKYTSQLLHLQVKINRMIADDEQQTEQSLQVPPATPGRIRSHSLRPQHSRIDYARRKSAADISSTIVTCWDSSNENPHSDVLNKPPSPSWLKRRFTFFSLEQPIDERRRMTTDRLSFFDEKSYSELLKQKRPSLIAQMMEVEIRFR